jgi:hypothetical protein
MRLAILDDPMSDLGICTGPPTCPSCAAARRPQPGGYRTAAEMWGSVVPRHYRYRDRILSRSGSAALNAPASRTSHAPRWPAIGCHQKRNRLLACRAVNYVSDAPSAGVCRFDHTARSINISREPGTGRMCPPGGPTDKIIPRNLPRSRARTDLSHVICRVSQLAAAFIPRNLPRRIA